MLKEMLKWIFESGRGAGDAPTHLPVQRQHSAPPATSETSAPIAEPPALPQPAGALTAEELEAQLVEKLNSMVRDANDRGMLQVFVDVAAWKLAAVALKGGPYIAGDIQARLGGHLRHMAEQDQAHKESDEARREGKLH
jgi:hypothetical protein